jgi:hypothetical protein
MTYVRRQTWGIAENVTISPSFSFCLTGFSAGTYLERSPRRKSRVGGSWITDFRCVAHPGQQPLARLIWRMFRRISSVSRALRVRIGNGGNRFDLCDEVGCQSVISRP